MTGPMPPEIASAIVQVMKGVKQLGFDEKNEHANYKYVSIDKFLDAFRPLLAEAGIFLVVDQTANNYREGSPGREGRVSQWLVAEYEVWIYHASGVTWGPLLRHLALPMTGPQTFGAAESYVQKRLLRTLFMVPTGENDADDTAPSEGGPAVQATRATPATRPDLPSRTVANAIVARIRAEIKNCVYAEELAKRGVYGPSADLDKAAILAQDGGDAVWADLTRRQMEAARRLSVPTEDER